MKKKKFGKVIIIGIPAILILLVAGMFVWSATGTYPAGTVAAAALESTDSVTVTQDKYIVFTPGEAPTTGLIFYPGGLVEPAAYAPVLHEIAESGVLVVITPMPLNLAIFNPNAANAVME
ncbi:MAG: alpha/beta hydrolase, partial [Anaerolineae bacterium]|nr:alpha/beta hydrolase [Anaerolineae bacterium]